MVERLGAMVERLEAMIEGLHARRRVWLAENPGLEDELRAAGELLWPEERDIDELAMAYETRHSAREVLAKIEGEIEAVEWLLVFVRRMRDAELV